MKDDLFSELVEGFEQAIAYQRGTHPNPESFVIHAPRRVDVSGLRARLGLSQAAFARTFSVSVATVRNWEQNRRTPEGPARVLLQVIEREPEAVIRALHLAETSGETRQKVA